jgi:Mg-chelatase subunit ChlD
MTSSPPLRQEPPVSGIGVPPARREVRFAAFCIAALALLAGAPAPVRAQSEAREASTRAAQFVVVIDDSGSMQKTDPNRLAVFAAQAFLSMLDDRDEVSIVRLNGPPAGETPPPIGPLATNRAAMQRLLGGPIAAYGGHNTTCRSALAATQLLLNRAYRPNVAQVVLFLTDGACTPAETERPVPAAFLGGLRSHEEDLFQFYLLRFLGEEVSPELERLARQTGGDAIPIGRADPTAVLHAFATALSRSQGYEAALLTPESPEIAAHRGAKRVRLLAVAGGESPPLELTVHDYQGRPALALGQPRQGVHRYQNHEPFRYVALDYRPGTEPVTVRVSGAGNAWKAVALPEYRLFLEMKAFEGACGAPGRLAGSGMETGSTACFVLDLVNENGATVGGDALGRDLEAAVLMRRAEQPAEAAVELPAETVGDRARFRLERARMEPGDWVFQPVVHLSLASGARVGLRGRRRLLQVASSTVTPEPAALDFDRVRPGEEVTRSFALRGNIGSTPAKLELRDRHDVPSCVTFELSGKPEGVAQPVTVGQPYTLALRVAPYCGPESLDLQAANRLRLAFEPAPGARYLPAVEIPIRFRLDYRIEPPREVVVKLRGGETGEVSVPVGGNRQKDLALRAVLPDSRQSARWPGEDLTLSFAGEGAETAGKDGASTRAVVLPRAAGTPLRLSARAARCCSAGSYRTELGLVPAAAAGYARGAEPPAPLVVPVRVEIESAGLWACYGPRLLLALALLLLLLLIAYGINMFRHSHFLVADRVAEKLVPLSWTTGGSTVDQRSSREAVLQMVRREIRWPARAKAWLRANPFAFGLKGAYRESLELFLQPQRDNSSALLVPQRDFPDRLRRDPESFRGRLFVVAQGSITFLGVPDPAHRLCQMSLDGAYRPVAVKGKPGEPEKPEVVPLKGQRILRHPEKWERRDGLPAGWRIG